MQEIWKTYKVPATVTCIGLVFALILGVVPLFDKKDSSPLQQAANSQIIELTRALEDLKLSHATEVADLRKAITAQAQLFSSIDNRLNNLDRGVTRTFWRSKKTAEFVETLAGANRKISNIENRLNNLDRGVTRTFWRSKQIADSVGALAGVNQKISNIDNRLTNLDRGVTRTFWRSKQNANSVDALAGANQKISNLEAQMNTLNVAVPRISGQIRQLQIASE